MANWNQLQQWSVDWQQYVSKVSNLAEQLACESHGTLGALFKSKRDLDIPSSEYILVVDFISKSHFKQPMKLSKRRTNSWGFKVRTHITFVDVLYQLSVCFPLLRWYNGFCCQVEIEQKNWNERCNLSLVWTWTESNSFDISFLFRIVVVIFRVDLKLII